MPATRHPDEDRLAAFSLGRLSSDESLDLEEHLEFCSECQAVVESIPDDGLIGLFRDSRAGISAVHAATRAEYRDFRFHARGGLGEVSLARDASLGRSVAVKGLRSELDSPARRRRFLREARITSRLEHPGVAPVYGLGEDDAGRPCYAMRFISGETLQDSIRTLHAAPVGPDTFRPLLQRFVALCSTVAYAHSRGVVHRDIKPANVAIGRFGETILLDWGLAWAADAPEEQLEPGTEPHPYDLFQTAAGTVLGTPGYMAPERVDGAASAPSADVYALGATLWTILTGTAPGEEGRFTKSMRSVAAIASKAMARDPADRYASAEALGQDVDRWLAGQPLSGVAEPWLVRIRRWITRHRLMMVSGTTAAGVLAAALAATAALLTNKNAQLQAALETATGNETLAGENASRAEAAARLAARNESKANANFKSAVQGTDLFFQSVYTEPRLREPDLAPFRRRLLDSAKGFYLQLLGQAGDSPELKSHLVMIHNKLGHTLQQFGELDAAVAEFRAALALLQAEPDQRSKVHHYNLYEAYHGLAGIARERLLHEDSLEFQRKARTEYGETTGDDPKDANVRAFKTRLLIEYATSLMFARKPKAETDAAYAETRRGIEEDLRREPAHPAVLANTVRFHHERGMAMMFSQQAGAGVESELSAARKALRTLPSAAWDGEEGAELHEIRAEVCSQLGTYYRGGQRYDDALSAYQEGERAAAQLLAKQPLIGRYRYLHAVNLYGAGTIHNLRRQPGLAEPLIREAIRVHVAIDSKSVGRFNNRRALFLARIGLAHTLVLLKRDSVSAKELQLARAQLVVDADDAPFASQLVAAWCSFNGEAKTDSASEQAFDAGTSIAASYAKVHPAIACRMLTRLADAGLFASHGRTDRLKEKSFDCLRERPEFIKLVARLDPASKP